MAHGHVRWTFGTGVPMTASMSPTRLNRSLALAAGLVLAQACSTAAPANPPGPKAPEPVARSVVNVEHDDGKSVEELFAGRFPGVQVFRTNQGGISIRIRGVNSFYGSSEPLYVIDGTPVQSGEQGLLFLNPADISQIEVLKDAAQTALYGVQGANGVVLITTKTARKR
jgi:TonB-dependent SusC/RagA subfamily outer membrane receptor